MQTIKDEATRSAKDEARRRAQEAARRTEATRKHKRQIVVAAVAMLALILTLTWAWMQRPKQLTHFTANDFAKVPGLETIANREPVLLVLVNLETWTTLPTEQKKAAVQKVADVVGPAGYQEVEFRASTRSGLAYWRKGKGIQID